MEHTQSTFANAVGLLFTEFRFSVTSWFRTPSRNTSVGGAGGSLHLTGRAVDVVLDRKEDLLHFTERARALGLKVLDEKTHLHVSPIKVYAGGYGPPR